MKAKREGLLVKKNTMGNRDLIKSCGGDKGNDQTSNGGAALVDGTIAL
jgi:hypothetical protein